MAKPYPVVAILDEDSDDRFLLKNAFEQCRQGIDIHTFGRGEDLLDYLSRDGMDDPGSVADLLILGLHLLLEDALEIVATIKSNPHLRHIPLIVLVGPVSDVMLKRLYDLGANTVIARPVLWDELVDVLKKICDYWFGVLKI
jgi:response regulator RpfG family c-di-GMP phosphodiesterase